MKQTFQESWHLAAIAALVVAVGVWILVRPSQERLPRSSAGTMIDTHTPEGAANMASAHTQSLVEHANDTTFQQSVLESPTPVLVDFYADWCGPCRMLAPILEQIAREVPDVKVVKVNVDDSPAVARHYRISSIPSLKVFQDGQVVAEQVGLASKAQLKALLGIGS